MVAKTLQQTCLKDTGQLVELILPHEEKHAFTAAVSHYLQLDGSFGDKLSLGYSFHPTYSLTSNSSKLTHMSVCTVINSLLWAVIGVLLGISFYIVYRNFTQQYREENQAFESASKRPRRLENGVFFFNSRH